jgi:hypothetical protein
VANEENTPESSESRTGYGQTAYKRALAYEHLGVDPASVVCIPFFRASLKRIARLLNHPRLTREPRSRPIRPFDCLQATDHPDACNVSRVYRSVPKSYRRLLPPEAFCIAAGVSTWRVLELIAAGAARQTGQASAIIAAIWHPQVVAKTIERALQDGGTRERMMLHRAVGFVR